MRTAEKWPRSLNRGGRLKRVYIQYYTDNSFGTLVTGRLIGGGRLMGGRLIGVRLYLQLIEIMKRHQRTMQNCFLLWGCG